MVLFKIKLMVMLNMDRKMDQLLTIAEGYISVSDAGWLLMKTANSKVYLNAELQPVVSTSPSMRDFKNRIGLFSRNFKIDMIVHLYFFVLLNLPKV